MKLITEDIAKQRGPGGLRIERDIHFEYKLFKKIKTS